MSRGVLAWGASGLVLGVLLGRATAPEREAPSIIVTAQQAPAIRAPPVAARAPAPAVVQTEVAVSPRCQEEPLRKRLALLEAKLRAQPVPERRDSSPVPFPERPADPAETPAGFRKLVDRVLAECAKDLTLSDLDCSEYPCIAWTRREGTAEHQKFDLSGCSAWNEGGQRAPIVLNAKAGGVDGGPRPDEYLAFFAFPADEDTAKKVKARARERLDGMLEAYGVSK